MPRKTSRRFWDGSARRSEDTPGAAGNSETLIAGMAQDFIQEQSKLADKALSASTGSQELLQLLQHIAGQLDHLNDGSRSGDKEVSTAAAAPEKTVPSDNGSAALPDSSYAKTAPKTQSGQTAAASSPAKRPAENNSPPPKLTRQTAGEAIAQAQYELANELEASLLKLKEVIAAGEKLAADISNLLGEEPEDSTNG